jgi:hypothetical protein
MPMKGAREAKVGPWRRAEITTNLTRSFFFLTTRAPGAAFCLSAGRAA